jgi:hypothetical protein
MEESGRLAVWRAEDRGNELRLQIYLDHAQGLELVIGADGYATATLSDHFAAWLAAEAQPVSRGAEP